MPNRHSIGAAGIPEGQSGNILQGTSRAPSYVDTPVTAIARLLGAMRHEESQQEVALSDSRAAGLTSAETYYEGSLEDLQDRSDTLEWMLSAHPAETVLDAAIQIAQAIAHVELLVDKIPNGVVSIEMKRDHRALRRLLFSALDIVDGAAPEIVKEVVCEGFAWPKGNPWTPVEKRCLELIEEGKVS